MIYETISVKGLEQSAPLTLYCLDNSPEIDPERRRPVILICPGGAYRFTSDREAEAVAVQMNAMGFHAAILRYSCAPARYPEALCQLARCAAFLRENAQRYAIDPQRVYVMGFSAGGHLAGSLGVFWDSPALAERVGLPCETFRPDRLILCYPVITSDELGHQESFENLTGCKREENPELWDKLSLENQVTPSVPQTFLWHTVEDGSVPVENSLRFASALRRCGVGFELHLYQHGGHGLSLATEEITCKATGYPLQPNCQSWLSLLKTWLKEESE